MDRILHFVLAHRCATLLLSDHQKEFIRYVIQQHYRYCWHGYELDVGLELVAPRMFGNSCQQGLTSLVA